MDELYATIIHVDTRVEEVEVIPSLNKQFARVFLEFKETEGGHVPHTLEVHGNVKGADKRTLQPVPGAFRCIPEESSEGGYEMRIPRQRDDSLILRRFDSEGGEFTPIPLGEIIRKAGFDWTQESLGDVSILADIPAMTFQITVMDWEGPITMTITI